MAVGIKKFTMEYLVPKIAKNLKGRFDAKQKAFKSIDEKGKGLSLQKRSNIKKSFSEKASKIFDDASKKRKEFKKGTGLRRPSNVEKIKKAFGPKEKPQSKMTRKKKFPDLTGDGKVTFADILKGRGVINGKKKKKII